MVNLREDGLPVCIELFSLMAGIKKFSLNNFHSLLRACSQIAVRRMLMLQLMIALRQERLFKERALEEYLD